MGNLKLDIRVTRYNMSLENGVATVVPVEIAAEVVPVEIAADDTTPDEDDFQDAVAVLENEFADDPEEEVGAYSLETVDGKFRSLIITNPQLLGQVAIRMGGNK